MVSPTANARPTRQSQTEFLTLGPVDLDVTDRGRSLRFWRDVVGLRVIAEDSEMIALGTRRDALIVLHPVATRVVRRGYTGLFHLAIHLPDEAGLAHAFTRLVASRWPITPTDHIMAKSIYLRDPDNIGLELSVETPERGRSMRITGNGVEVVDASGRLRRGSEALDVDELLAALSDDPSENGMPVGSFIGHVHLSVSDLESAFRFYSDGLGMLQHLHSRRLGFADLHAGGRYEHRIALNTWQGVGAQAAPAGSAGLRQFTIEFDSRRRLRDALARVHAVEPRPGEAVVRDPATHRIHLCVSDSPSMDVSHLPTGGVDMGEPGPRGGRARNDQDRSGSDVGRTGSWRRLAMRSAADMKGSI